MQGVLEVQSYGDKLRVFVDDVASRRPQMETSLASAGIRCEGLRESRASMEEAFISLVKREAESAATRQRAVETSESKAEMGNG